MVNNNNETADSEEIVEKGISSRQILRWGIFIFVLLVVFVSLLPLMVTHCSIASLYVDKSNGIGDTIGGIMGPVVGIIGAALTFLAFWAQYDANKEQRRQFIETIEKQKISDKDERERFEKEQKMRIADLLKQREQFNDTYEQQQQQIVLQDRRTRLDSFESKFYTMLSIHRDNVKSMDINKITGGKTFLHLLDELKFIYWVTKNYYDTYKSNVVLNEHEIYQVAYLSFFFGIGEKSTPLVKDLGGFRLQQFIQNCHHHILNMPRASDEHYETNTTEGVLKWEIIHTLGVGHLRRLSHYIRHLFQTVKFVNDQDDKLLSPSQKYDYVTNLRAQLSVHEQLLLYYNALSVLGEPWLEIPNEKSENYLMKYCMIKSIPLNSTDFYLKAEDIFPERNNLGKPIFEWIEIRERVKKAKDTGEISFK